MEDKFYETNRGILLDLVFPSIGHVVRETHHIKAVRNVTDIKTMEMIPSKSVCEVWHETLSAGRCKAISCELGTFDDRAVATLVKLHGLRDVAENVRQEKAWLETTVLPLHENCLPPDANRTSQFESILFQNADGRVVLNRTILASDLSVLAGNKWLNLTVIQGFLDILNGQSIDTKAFILNSLTGLEENVLEDQLKKHAKKTVKYFTFVICVGGNITETFLGTPYHQGCHWSLLYVDTVTNEWFYCDSLGWAAPKELKYSVDKVISAFATLIQLPRRPVQGRYMAHIASNTCDGVHQCSAFCLRNIPLQKCGNVCGVVAIILCAISCIDKHLWRNSFLKSSASSLPENISWLRHPTTYAAYLRRVLIDWLMAKYIDLHLIGYASATHIGPNSTRKPKQNILKTRKNTLSNTKTCGTRTKKEVMTDSVPKMVTYKRKETTASIKKTLSGGIENQIIIDNAQNDVKSGRKETTAGINTNNDTSLLPEKEITEEMMIDNVHNDTTSDGKKTTNTNNDIGLLPEEEIKEEMIIDDVQNDTTSDGNKKTNTNNDTGLLPEEEIKEEMMIDNVQNDTMSDRKKTTVTNNDTLLEEIIEENIQGKDDSSPEIKREKGVFYVGQGFASLDEMERTKNEYENDHFCELWKKDVRTLVAAQKRVPNRVAIANPSLQYYSLLLSCKFGGQPRKKESRIRKTKSFRQGCTFQVYITLALDGQALEVMRVAQGHNHQLSKELYEHLPRQRALSEECKERIADAIKLKANTKLLQRNVVQTTGKRVTLKDIANLKQKCRKEFNKNDLDDVIGLLKRQQGAIVELLIDSENNFKGLFYQDSYMRNIYSKFPELLLVDATYKLLDLRLPVYLLLCVDGDGLSEIAGMFILAEETKDVIEAAVQLFQKFNPNWGETQVIMSDKDFTERDAFAKCFPSASLNICLFHTLRSFRREVTCEKMGISSAERLRCLEILTQLAYSKSPSSYECHLKALNDASKSVREYVVKNWLPVKEQWVSCFKDNDLNLGETTNNRLECTFSKIKSVCSKYASLVQFFHEFFSVLSSLRSERDHHYLMTLARKSTEHKNLNVGLRLYADYLTPYSFNFINKQFSLIDSLATAIDTGKGTFQFSSSTGYLVVSSAFKCNCSFVKRMGLPCRHIFKVRTILNMPLFEKSLVRERWTIDYYKTKKAIKLEPPNAPSGQQNDNEMAHVQVQPIPVTKERKALSQAQKFRNGLKLSQELASLVSEGGMPTFTKRYDLLKNVIKYWKLGVEVELVPLTERGDTTKQSQDPANLQTIETDSHEDFLAATKDCPKAVEVSKTAESCAENPSRKSEYDFITMPPKIRKRGRPKGAELTVIGLPKCKKSKDDRHKSLPFCKLQPDEKSRIILECLTAELAAAECLSGKRLLSDGDVKSNIQLIPDTVRDEENIDINRVQKYFNNKGWLAVLNVLEKKRNAKWCCSYCDKVLADNQESIACDRCLLWFHFACTTLKKQPKSRNLFCRCCKAKLL